MCADKDYFNVRAEAALHGIAVHRLFQDGAVSYLMTRHLWSAICATLDEVREQLKRLEVTA